MRLLTGPLCRLGAADLDGLMAWARHPAGPAARPLRARRPADDDDAQGALPARRPSAGRRRRRCATRRPTAPTASSIVEAVDDLPPPGWRADDGPGVSATWRCQRLLDLREADPPPAVADRRCRWPTSSARPSAPWASTSRCWPARATPLPRPGPTLTPSPTSPRRSPSAPTGPPSGGFLAWLAAALKEERGLDKGYIEASTDAVQVLTVHAAKGLEWDAVAVPGLVEGSFPALSSAPAVVQGRAVADEPADRQGLGRRPVRRRSPTTCAATATGCRSWLAARPRLEGHGGRDRAVRQRRRASTASRRSAGWPTSPSPGPGRHAAHRPGVDRRQDPKVTSRFLTEVLDHDDLDLSPCRARLGALPEPDDARQGAEPPQADPVVGAVAGRPPRRAPRRPRRGGGSGRGAAIEEPCRDAAGRRRQARAGRAARCRRESRPSSAGAREIELLLRERRRAADRSDVEVLLPRHLSASRSSRSPRTPSRSRSSLRRPMPAPPALAARRGTAFHAWVEQHFAQAAMVDLLDLPGSADEDPGDDADLPLMKEHFLASEWAHRTPEEIEIAIETVIDGIAVRGRIDAVFPPAGRRLHRRRLEDGGQADRGAGAHRGPCSSRPTGWRSRGCAGWTPTRSTARSTTPAAARPCGRQLPDEAELDACCRPCPTETAVHSR